MTEDSRNIAPGERVRIGGVDLECVNGAALRETGSGGERQRIGLAYLRGVDC